MPAIATPEFLISQQTGEEFEFDAAREIAEVHLFREWLHELDVRLDILYAKPGAKLLDGGYWYIYRRNEAAVPTYWKVSDADGRPCVPDRRHIEMLERIDGSRHPRIYQEYRQRQDRARRAKEETAEDRHREFREKLDEKLKHIYEADARIFLPGYVKDKLAGGAALPDAVARTLDPEQRTMEIVNAAEVAAGLAPTAPPTQTLQGEPAVSSPGDEVASC